LSLTLGQQCTFGRTSNGASTSRLPSGGLPTHPRPSSPSSLISSLLEIKRPLTSPLHFDCRFFAFVVTHPRLCYSLHSAPVRLRCYGATLSPLNANVVRRESYPFPSVHLPLGRVCVAATAARGDSAREKTFVRNSEFRCDIFGI
jgi:hypothetical protein